MYDIACVIEWTSGGDEDALRRGVGLALPRQLQYEEDHHPVEVAVTRVGVELRGNASLPLVSVTSIVYVFAIRPSIVAVVRAIEEFDSVETAALVEALCFQCSGDDEADEMAAGLGALIAGPVGANTIEVDLSIHGRGALGFKVATVGAKKGFERGVFVVHVQAGSPAASAQLAVGALIVRVGDHDATHATADDAVGWIRREQVETGYVRLRVKQDNSFLQLKDEHATPVVRFRAH